MLAAAVFLVAIVSGFFVTDGGDFGARFSSEKSQHDPITEPDTVDTPTVEEARQMIVGTWIEDVDGGIDSYEKGDLKWVFTEDGTVQKYEDGKLYATQEYAVVGAYKGKQAPEDIAGYLRFTDQDGDVRHMTLTSIRRGPSRPHLYVKTHGMAGDADPLYFVPVHVFE